MESKNELYYILARNALEKLMNMGHLTCEQYAWVFRENGPCVRRKRSTLPAKMVQHSAGAVHLQWAA